MKSVIVWVRAMNLYCPSKARLCYLEFILPSAWFVSADDCHLSSKRNWIGSLNGLIWINELISKHISSVELIILKPICTYLIGLRLLWGVLQYLLTIKKGSSSLLSQRLWWLEPSPGGSSTSLSGTFLCSAYLFLHSAPAFVSSCCLAALCQLYWCDRFNTLTHKDQV